MEQLSISWLGEPHANHSATPATEADSKTREAHSHSNTSESCETSSHDGSFGRTSEALSAQTEGGISMQSFQSLPSSGIVLGGEFLAAPSSVCLSQEIECSLLDVLEAPQNISDKYYLSRKSIQGHYRRILKAGKARTILPSIWAALCTQSTTQETEYNKTKK